MIAIARRFCSRPRARGLGALALVLSVGCAAVARPREPAHAPHAAAVAAPRDGGGQRESAADALASPGEPAGERTASPDAHDTHEMDLYAESVARHARSGWAVPADLPPEDLAQRVVTVAIELDAEQRPISYTIARPSGDARFDTSVEEHLRRLIDAGAAFPPSPASHPPPRRLMLRFRGAGAR